MKYQPDYPGRFGTVDETRAWLPEFFRWHNHDHHHTGLALFTPAEVFFERVPAVHAVRQEALDIAFALHPARFPNGAPKAALPPAEVNINPLEVLAITVPGETSVSSKNTTAPLSEGTALVFGSEKAPHATARTPAAYPQPAATSEPNHSAHDS